MSPGGGHARLFRRMLVEEYRLHGELFGGGRFVAFPAFVAVVVAGGTWLLALTGTEVGAIVAGIHGLVLFFGLQVGTIGLVGRDAMRDALGDVTLLVFSARTLPISWPRLLATFLVKDLVYYAGFFLTPIAVGFGAVVVLAPGQLSGFGLPAVGLLWLTTTGTFALGAAASLALVGLATRSRMLVLALVAVGTAVVLGTEFDPVALTPYAFFGAPGLETAVLGFAPILVFGALGPVLLTPTERGGARRIRRDRYGTIRDRLGRGDGLAARPLLEVARSSGSVWKVAFSLGVLFAVTALLLDRVAAATGLEPSAGIAFGTLLGLGTFTTYNWVTQMDDAAEYRRYPVPTSAVFAGARRAFLVLALPTGVAFLALGALWYPPADLAIGILVFPLASSYVYGLTAYLTGLSPNELLFDTALFAVFGGGLALLAVPLLVAALAYQQSPLVATGVAVGVAAVAAVVGALLGARAGPRWDRRQRATL
ncbi:MAG: hypothetical protein V5A18_10635 [Haloarculaceae archaeon]